MEENLRFPFKLLETLCSRRRQFSINWNTEVIFSVELQTSYPTQWYASFWGVWIHLNMECELENSRVGIILFHFFFIYLCLRFLLLFITKIGFWLFCNSAAHNVFKELLCVNGFLRWKVRSIASNLADCLLVYLQCLLFIVLWSRSNATTSMLAFVESKNF